jgi:hypothetical protein
MKWVPKLSVSLNKAASLHMFCTLFVVSIICISYMGFKKEEIPRAMIFVRIACHSTISCPAVCFN